MDKMFIFKKKKISKKARWTLVIEPPVFDFSNIYIQKISAE